MRHVAAQQKQHQRLEEQHGSQYRLGKERDDLLKSDGKEQPEYQIEETVDDHRPAGSRPESVVPRHAA